MCREILNSCVRNTEEAERLSKASEGSGVQSGRGLRKGVWGMIEESELAKSIRKGEEKRVSSNIYVFRAFLIAYPFSLIARKRYIDPCTTMRGTTQARSFHSNHSSNHIQSWIEYYQQHCWGKQGCDFRVGFYHSRDQ